MKVEYDELARQFRIYRSEYDLHYVCLQHDSDFQSYRVLGDDRFEVIGRFGERIVYNADGRVVL